MDRVEPLCECVCVCVFLYEPTSEKNLASCQLESDINLDVKQMHTIWFAATYKTNGQFGQNKV